MDMHSLVDNILESYNELGGINEAGAESFPNRENVVAVINDLQSLVFPGYRTGQRVNRVLNTLTK